MREDFVVIEPSQAQDPAKLDAVLEAQMAIEQARARRDAWMHLLALASVPIWVVAAWPSAVADGVRSLLLAAWAACFAAVLAIIGSEWRTRRRQSALLDTLRSAGKTRGI